MTGDRLATTIYVVKAVVLVLAVAGRLAITRSITGPLARLGRRGQARGRGRPHLADRSCGRDEAAELLARFAT